MPDITATTAMQRRLGRIERAILLEIQAAGGRSSMISSQGRGTGIAIDRLVSRGLLALTDDGNAWRITPQGALRLSAPVEPKPEGSEA